MCIRDSLYGGMEGAGGEYFITRTDGTVEKLMSKCTDVPLHKGDIVTVHTPGAGGYGCLLYTSICLFHIIYPL